MRSDEITIKHTESVRSQPASKARSLPSIPKRLRTGVPAIQASSWLSSFEEKVVVINEKLDSISQSVAAGFSKIQAAVDSFSELLHAVNLPKGERNDRSDKGDSDQPPREPQGSLHREALLWKGDTSRGKKKLPRAKGRESSLNKYGVFDAYDDGEEFYMDQAILIMLDSNESVIHNQDNQFEKLIQDAKSGIGN
ncbi:hypothetical protein DCAR_0830860 [Daucus carota subsp. sativus]|uniref:Uncharacterized protein n=1 Tax=Daucus carota subsp. sativus TaxID=79200 RepID=A0A175YKN1_DAUCS|nr:hypothetical protein DCAR_0830860 [Daucus carota subsp. sativus]